MLAVQHDKERTRILYRWNTDLKRWELWTNDNGWIRSMYNSNRKATKEIKFYGDDVIKYSATWAEPFQGMKDA